MLKRYVPLQEKDLNKGSQSLRSILLEQVASHKDSIINFSDQLAKFLQKNQAIEGSDKEEGPRAFQS